MYIGRLYSKGKFNTGMHRVFQRARMYVRGLLRIIKDEIKMWNLAGAGIPFDPG